ncbi:hypothetical protein [Microbacterium sp. NPDC055683]
MHTTFRLYPWDVDGDPAAAARLRDAGVERVSLAATYHAARVVTPHHPRHRILTLPASASYLDDAVGLPRGTASFARARAALEAEGIAVGTWAVIGHLDDALRELPRVVNAFGDELPHAPCLSHVAVREALRAISAAAARAAVGENIHLEAIGWQGLAHGSLHDKIHGADLSPVEAELLSLCVCAACADAAGLEAPAAAVRAGDRDVVSRLREARTATADAFARLLVDDALAIGAREVCVAVEQTGGLDGDPRIERLVDCWGTPERGVAALDRAGGGTAYLDILSTPREGFAAHWRALVSHGADRLHVYHAGLASPARLAAAVAAAAQFS